VSFRRGAVTAEIGGTKKGCSSFILVREVVKAEGEKKSTQGQGRGQVLAHQRAFEQGNTGSKLRSSSASDWRRLERGGNVSMVIAVDSVVVFVGGKRKRGR